MKKTNDIHPTFDSLLGRADKEALLGQTARVFWLYGLSGSGKSTLANVLERSLHGQGRATVLLDGDNLRTGLNKGLGFTDADRAENIRRAAEVAKLFLNNGTIVIASFITPKAELRRIAREIIGTADFSEIYVSCPFETCAARDVKGLYAKANAGGVANFTGRDSGFEVPESADLTINTAAESVEASVDRLLKFVSPLITLSK